MGFGTKVSRVFDRRPWASHLYLTDQCNLSCHYCNEFDNETPHPATSDLKKWLRKLRDLGVMRVNFLGGEPLLHPHVVELVRFARRIGFFTVGMSTNGLLLTEQLVRDLEEAGLGSLQISVDRMTPIEGTQKSLKSVKHKLEWFKNSKIRMGVSGVMYRDTINQTKQVIDTCLDMGVPVGARLIHDDLINKRQLREEACTHPCLELIDYQLQLKNRRERIHITRNILQFQRKTLIGRPHRWECVAGYKYFFVSAGGKFWPCSQLRTDKDIMDITLDDLKAFDKEKSCQDACGVYCIISNSFMFNHPMRYVWQEICEGVEGKIAKIRHRIKKALTSYRTFD